MAAHHKARIWAIVGASGSGKGLWGKGQLRELQPSRLVVLDLMDEYDEFAQLMPSLESIRRAMIKAGGAGALRVRYIPKGAGDKELRREFEALCSLVYAWGSCTFVAEELSNFTTPGWAPAAWRKMTTSGRHCNVHVMGYTQTPALVDKTFLGNCTLIHCGSLREHPHRLAMARSMDIDPAEIAALPDLHFIERDFVARELRRGTVTPPGGAPRAPRPRPTGDARPSQAGKAAPTVARPARGSALQRARGSPK